MKAKDHAASISTLTLGLLTLAYLSASTASDDYARAGYIMDARRDIARSEIQAQLHGSTHWTRCRLGDEDVPPLPPRSPPAGTASLRYVLLFFGVPLAILRPRDPRDDLLATLQRAPLADTWNGHERQQAILNFLVSLGNVVCSTSRTALGDIEITLSAPEVGRSPRFQVRVDEPTEHSWVAAGNLWELESSASPLDRLVGRERDFAIEEGLPQQEDSADATKVFIRFHTQLLSQRMKVPVIDQEIRGRYILWVLLVLTPIILVIVRNRLRYVFTDPELGATEPWLMVDPAIGLEKWVSNFWLFGLVLAPWLIGAATLMTEATYIVIDGAVSSATHDVVVFGSAVSLMVLGGWLAVVVASRLLHLRHLRHKLLEIDLTPPTETAVPPEDAAASA